MAIGAPIPQTAVSGGGLSGILYKRLLQGKRWSKREVDWLHDYTPRPYSMTPVFTNEQLTGMRFGVLSDRAYMLLHEAWQQAIQQGMRLRLGRYEFVPTYLHCHQGRGFAELQENSGAAEMTLHFLSPTAFKQGDDAKGKPMLQLLPVPRNVFTSLFRAWQAYAPPPQQLPEAWLDWCARHILVSRHEIQTATFAIKHKSPTTFAMKQQLYLGFVGNVSFEARDNHKEYRQIWHALGQFAPFCGVGTKRAIGLGAVDYVVRSR
ncbi:MAG: CRISPR system precrRNA processing endoribonuclease RAMP protein Cas6 [Aquificales bacterium]|nr:CRISPR system precrRNA processing endoribonuclease RAMP protein Cas6 [Aquificales bacterium]